MIWETKIIIIIKVTTLYPCLSVSPGGNDKLGNSASSLKSLRLDPSSASSETVLPPAVIQAKIK